MSNEIIYYELMENLFPKDLFTEVLSEYYGTDKREFISERVSNIDVVFVPKKLSSYKIQQAFRNCRDNEAELEKQSDYLIGILNYYKNQQVKDKVVIKTLIENQDIVAELGFDLHQIIKKRKLTGQLTFVDTEETRRFKQFIADEITNTRITENNINFDSFINYYNNCAQEKFLFDIQSVRSNGQFYVNAVGTGQWLSEELLKNNFFIINELQEEDKQFLFDLLESKVKLENLDRNSAKYVVKNINRIFSTNYRNAQEMFADARLLLFFGCVDMVKPHVKQFIYDENIGKNQYISQELTEQEYDGITSYFDNNPNAIAVFYNFLNEHQNVVGVSLGVDISLAYTMHEANHVLAANSVYGLGFDKYNYTGSREDYGLKAFNEFVNEFLTKRAIENYNSKLENGVKPIEQAKSGYDVGIDVMKRFLLKFETKLKECQLSAFTWQNATKTMEDYIGVNNFNKLVEFSAIIAENNWGFLNLPINEHFTTDNIATWITEYKKNPELLNLISGQTRDTVIKFIEMDKFFEKLVENFNIFEQGTNKNEFEVKDEEFLFNETIQDANSIL